MLARFGFFEAVEGLRPLPLTVYFMDMQYDNRKEEGRLLKQAWLRYKSETNDTQLAFCGRIGLDQGQLQGWFSGRQIIPEEGLLKVAAEMNINPAKIRPSLREKALKLIRLTHPLEIDDIRSRLNHLDHKQLKDLSDFLDYLDYVSSKNKNR